MTKNVVVLALMCVISACGMGPRTAVGLASFDGRKVEISVLEQDVSASESSATISFDDQVVHSSILQTWDVETNNSMRQVASTDFQYQGKSITVKRKFDVGASGVLTNYLLYVDDQLISAIPIAF